MIPLIASSHPAALASEMESTPPGMLLSPIITDDETTFISPPTLAPMPTPVPAPTSLTQPITLPAPRDSTGLVIGLIPLSLFTSPGERMAARFATLTPRSFAIYFATSALARPMPPAIQMFWANTEEYEWRNQRLRWAFKRLLLHWSAQHIINMNDFDVTAMVPISEISAHDLITFTDVSQKRGGIGLYRLHAQTMTNLFVMELEKQTGLFPDPCLPRNPFTNLPLTIGQLIIIYDQLTRRFPGHLPPAISLFRAAQFSADKFARENAAFLRWRVVKRSLNDKTRAPDMIAYAWEEMYHKTLYPAYTFLIDEFATISRQLTVRETHSALYELAAEYLELQIGFVIRNPHHQSTDFILHEFRRHVVDTLVNTRLQSRRVEMPERMLALLARAREAITAPPPPTPVAAVAPVPQAIITISAEARAAIREIVTRHVSTIAGTADLIEQAEEVVGLAEGDSDDDTPAPPPP